MAQQEEVIGQQKQEAESLREELEVSVEQVQPRNDRRCRGWCFKTHCLHSAHRNMILREPTAQTRTHSAVSVSACRATAVPCRVWRLDWRLAVKSSAV